MMRMFTRLFIYLTAVLGILLIIGSGIASLSFGIKDNTQSLKIFGYCLFGLAFLILVALIFLRKKINLTAALFTECCRGIQHNPVLLIVATFIFVILCAFVGFWITGCLFLFSVPEESANFNIPHTAPHFNAKIRNLMYFNLFGFYWVVGFSAAVYNVVIAGVISSWYFFRDSPPDKVKSPALFSLRCALTKSFGSLAFGSLLIAIIQFLEFMVNKLKAEASITSNAAVKCGFRIIRCGLECIHGLLRWINKWAYIGIAIQGESFVTSAKNSFDLISRNSFSAVVVDILGDIVLLVGKLLGTSICTTFALICLQLMHRDVSPITMAAVVITSFIVFSIFSSIISVGIDTVLLCYLMDLETSNGENTMIDPDLHLLLQDKARAAAVKSVNHS